MEWAQRRKIIAWGIFGAVVAALLAILAIAILYQTPTCIDQKQNQGETGIDCGGPCKAACTAAQRPAQVRFARAVMPGGNRTDVIAYIDNPNAGASAQGVHGTVTVYDAAHALLASKDVTFDLSPGGLTPLLLIGILSSSTAVTQTFLTIEDANVRWVRSTDKPVVPTVKNLAWQNTDTPRVTATLVNPIAKPLTDVRLVATVFDASGTAIAASSTIVPSVPAQGTAQAVFTWNVPFAGEPARVEILPVVSLGAL